MHRRNEFRASKIMLERARSQPNIEFVTPYTVKEFVAGETGALGHATLTHAETGEEREIPITGVFIAVGHDPQSGLVRGQVDLDESGYVVTEAKSTRTKRPGVFAAGDLVDHTYRQAITAAGSGCQAALDAEWYLRDTPGDPDPDGHAARRPGRSAVGACRRGGAGGRRLGPRALGIADSPSRRGAPLRARAGPADSPSIGHRIARAGV